MKKILLLACSLFITAGSFAQSFSTSSGSNDTVSAAYSGTSPFDVHNDVASTSSTAVVLKWRVINASFGPGWDINSSGVCDNIECRTNIATLYNNGNGVFQKSDPYTSLSAFKVQFFGTNVPSGSRAIVTIRATDTVTNYSRTLTFIAHNDATAIGQVSNDNSVSVYPNPAREAVNVIFDRQADVKTIAIYNMIGKAMRIFKPTDNNSAKLDLDNIPSGVYFVRLMNSDGEIVATRRFTRQ